MLTPMTRMWERVEIARQDSDMSLFLSLLYMGEMVTKMVAAGLVAALPDDRDRHRYRQLYNIVRADSLGVWSQAMDEVLTGLASQVLPPQAREEQKELTQKVAPGDWRYDMIHLLEKCITAVDGTWDRLPLKASGRRFFSSFVALRNMTRGHGATQPTTCAEVCPDLEESLRLLGNNLGLFKRPWVYLHRNLSGKYRVTLLGGDPAPFAPLKSSRDRSYPDGIYIYFDEPRRADLLESDPDATDFYFANGGFDGKRYEMISYITDSRMYPNAAPYMTPPGKLPPSETQGLQELKVQGQCFANLPPVPSGYVHRTQLESELECRLNDDRHPIVTLVGRGGIGKTSLALSVLHRVSSSARFGAIVWFSARDIDLSHHGPRPVGPQHLTEKEMACELADLMEVTKDKSKDFDSLDYFRKALARSPWGEPILFVFDNFETVRSPFELYNWIDISIRPPNKVLITTRIRDFKGDYPVEISGMTEEEADELITSAARSLGALDYLNRAWRQDAYRESEGHPYVIKILLGEVAKARKALRVQRILAGRDDVLDALFERTFEGLSPAAKRVFLTLCNWRSTVPQLAVEAVLLRPANERMDVGSAIEELRRSSFVEVMSSTGDDAEFLTVPLVASLFGQRKLAVSPMNLAVAADTELLRTFGAAQKSDVRHGVAPRVNRMFREIASRISRGDGNLGLYLPMLEFVARRFGGAWLLLASLHEEFGGQDGVESAKKAIRHYLESPENEEGAMSAWRRLSQVCFRTGDTLGEIHALVEMCQIPEVPFYIISEAANKLNGSFRQCYLIDTEEKRIALQKMGDVMKERIGEGDATDCSRLAWLLLYAQDAESAKKYVWRGLGLDSHNEHLRKLAERLSITF